MSVPELSPQDLQKATRDWYTARRDSLLLAFYGVGGEGRVHVDELGADVSVIPVDSELRLRERMLEVEAGSRAVFLLPWEGMLPMDLRGRFAKKGKIQRIGRRERIKNLFGAIDMDADIGDSPLVRYLLDHHSAEKFTSPGGRLTLDVLWRAWLERAWGLPGGELALDGLLGFAAVDGHGPAFVTTLEKRAAQGVRAALLVHLEERLGICGPVVWQAWEEGKGRELMHLAIFADALEGVEEPRAQVWLEMEARALTGPDAEPQALLSRLAEVSDRALRVVKQRSGLAGLRTLAKEADARVTLGDVRSSLVASNLLPSAWQGRLDALGMCLKELAADPTQELLADAVSRFRALETHDLFKEGEYRLVMLRAQMAVRLAGWLQSRVEIAPSASSYGDAEALANWFVSEGGYIDWARKAARGGRDGAFGAGVSAIVDKADALRLALDLRFAKALPAWVESSRPSKQVLPIDHAIRRVAGKFLEENPERKLLVLLMDGMAWSQAAEILESLGQEAALWGPLAWHGIAKHRIGDAPYPAMLTNFPSVTEVSRSAFFAGKCMPSGKVNSSTDDPKKWQANKEVSKFYENTDSPKLLLRGEGQSMDGSASPEALSLVADSHRRLVGIVINAIDMSLKTDSAHRHEWRVDTIKAMRDLLDKAREVGRAVMLVADHGNVPSDLVTTCGRADGGHRYRAWKQGEAVADYEVALPSGEGVWTPRGADGVVLLADDRHRYGGSAGSGEHGGAALAEVVAPCLLIGCEDNPGIADDAAQSVRPAPVPSWWHFDVGRVLSASARSASDSGASASANKVRKKTPKSQLSLPQMAPPKVVPEAAAEEIALVPESAFARCEMLKTRTANKAERDKVVKAVAFLVERNGIAEAAAFAQAMGEFLPRVGGLVSRLQEVLNVDGYQVVRYERQSQQVRLDKEALSQQFEVEL